MCATSFSVVQKTTTGLLAAALAAQRAQEFDAGHVRHVPVEQDHVGHVRAAGFQRRNAVLGLVGREVEILRMRQATLRMTRLSSTTRQDFMQTLPRPQQARRPNIKGKA